MFSTLQAYVVDSLIKAYKLSDHMDVFKVKPATYEDLIGFHASSYIDFLKIINDSDSSGLVAEDDYGLGYYFQNILYNLLVKIVFVHNYYFLCIII